MAKLAVPLPSVVALRTSPPLAVSATWAPLIGCPNRSTSLRVTGGAFAGVPVEAADEVELDVLVELWVVGLWVVVLTEVVVDVTVMVVVVGGKGATDVVELAVVELVAVDDEEVVELVVCIVDVDVLVLLVVVIDSDVDTTKTRLVFPCIAKPVVPPPPFAPVLEKLPMFELTT